MGTRENGACFYLFLSHWFTMNSQTTLIGLLSFLNYWLHLFGIVSQTHSKIHVTI